MGVSYSWACRGVACAFLCAVLCYLSSASWSALVANVGAAAVVTTLFFDVAVLGSVVLAIVGMITGAGIIAALLLGIWGEELVVNLQRMGASAFKSALCVLPIAAVWVYTMVQLEALSVRWGVFLCLLAMGCAAVTVTAGQIFTLVIVRVLILPACLPGKVFSMLTGMPEDALDQCRETMTTQHNWEPLAVTPAEDGAQVDAMIWEGYADKSGGSEGRKSRRRWVIWFLGNGARYEECHQEMEEYAQDLGVSVCAFNYRGVGRSSGLAWKFEDLVTDGNLVLQALCERMQLTPSEVLLHGHSLGGAVSALVRVENPGAALINDRSFGALSEVPVAWCEQLTLTLKLLSRPLMCPLCPYMLIAYRSFGLDRARQLSNHAGDPLPTAVLDAVCALIPYLMTTMGWAAPVNEQWVRTSSPSFQSSSCSAFASSTAYCEDMMAMTTAAICSGGCEPHDHSLPQGR
eukprot:COSAG03_NODE_1680_length_3653_cov_5.604108_3_plen_461_part_00